ncbi:MAG: MFS transporter [Nitrospinae bacterium]|nr:MFS transporter [Nitrospinota bacterium]
MPQNREGVAHHNSLYLIAAIATIFMTMAIAVQPLFLYENLNIARDNAGFINSNILVITEVIDLLVIGYFGYLSDRFGRIPIIFAGFIIAGVAASLTPFSAQIGAIAGVGGLAMFYFFRVAMSLGTTAVWPQLVTLAGDFSIPSTRVRLMANAGFMMAFGAALSYAVLMRIPQEIGVSETMLFTAGLAFTGAWLSIIFMKDVGPRLKEPKIPFDRVALLLRRERKLRLAFLSSFTSRNDIVIIGLFLMIWHVYFADLVGMDHAYVAGRAGMIIGVVGLTALISIPFWTAAISRWGKVAATMASQALIGAGFIGFALIINPFTLWPYIPAVLVGVGQAGCLLAPQILLIDIVPEDIRGSTLGAFNIAGCAGIIVLLQTGGILFDTWGPPAPFAMAGLASFMVAMYALYTMRTEGEVGEAKSALEAS